MAIPTSCAVQLWPLHVWDNVSDPEAILDIKSSLTSYLEEWPYLESSFDANWPITSRGHRGHIVVM